MYIALLFNGTLELNASHQPALEMRNYSPLFVTHCVHSPFIHSRFAMIFFLLLLLHNLKYDYELKRTHAGVVNAIFVILIIFFAVCSHRRRFWKKCEKRKEKKMIKSKICLMCILMDRLGCFLFTRMLMSRSFLSSRIYNFISRIIICGRRNREIKVLIVFPPRLDIFRMIQIPMQTNELKEIGEPKAFYVNLLIEHMIISLLVWWRWYRSLLI